MALNLSTHQLLIRAVPDMVPEPMLVCSAEFFQESRTGVTSNIGRLDNMAVNDSQGGFDFDNVYPAVIECFIIILSGYVAGRLNWISKLESSGLNTFVSHFALPSLIFHSLATLKFSSINWKFLASICIAKSILFIIVMIVTLLVNRPLNYGKAGLYSIFCTQSNDFALGYPIVEALYRNTHKDYSSYLYLAAPISLIILNPIGFILMEIDKHKRSTETRGSDDSRAWIVFRIVRGVFLNPIVLMTLAGILGNVVFRQTVPVILDGILKVLGSAFSATALFSLGIHMVGKVSNLKGKTLVTTGILIALKILVLPLLIRETVTMIQPGASANETVDFSMFGFLYGTFPSAPGVFVYAVQYNLEVDLVASAMVACTFISAPIMFLSAKMITLEVTESADYLPELNKFLFNISIVSLVACIWVIVIFIMGKKWNKVPQYATFCLVISQLIACVGSVLWSSLSHESDWLLYLEFIIFTFGVYSSRVWGALLAVTLVLLRWRSLCFTLRMRTPFVVIGWGIPIVAVTILCTFFTRIATLKNRINPNFTYGTAQAAIAGVLLLCCCVVIVFCLITQQRMRNRSAEYQSLLANDDEISTSINNSQQNFTSCHGDACKVKQDKSGSCCIQDIEDYTSSPCEDALLERRDDLCSTIFPCTSTQRQKCTSTIRNYHSVDLANPEINLITDNFDESLRHTALTLILCLSSLVGFALCCWHFVLEEPSGIYIELEFLDGALNFGQGLLVFALFGLDSRLLVSPIIRRWRRFWYRITTLQSDDQEIKLIAEQFKKYHYEKCAVDLVKDRKCGTNNYKSVFRGNELVDWLLAVGLAHDRTEAIKYGQQLLLARVLKHKDGEQTFCDLPIFYILVFKSFVDFLIVFAKARFESSI
uniref:DEP domain-containing protein n=1 Tax=Strigamia maritima TaxID=126957 RepID=T1IYY0_STRMM